MDSPITVEAAKQLRNELEQELREKIVAFNGQTGLKVENIYLEYISSGSMENPNQQLLNEVKTEIILR